MKKLVALETQQQANQELMKKLVALETEVKRLRELSADGRLARIVN